MSGRESKHLEKLYPFSMPGIELRLVIEELKCLIGWVKSKLIGFEVLTPLIQCPHYYIKFFVVGWVVELWATNPLIEMARDFLSRVNIALIHTLLASHSTSNNSLMFGNARACASYNLCLMVSNAFQAADDYVNLPFFTHSVSRATMKLKSLINLL